MSKMGILHDIQILSGGKPPVESVQKDTRNGKKILVVEDDTALSGILEEKLTKEGYSVTKAGNGQEGLDTVVSLKPDCILLDLMMPVMSGQTMLHRLRQMPEFKKLPVIVLTNAGEADNMQDAHFQNAYFLIKSNVSLDEIIKTIHNLI